MPTPFQHIHSITPYIPPLLSPATPMPTTLPCPIDTIRLFLRRGRPGLGASIPLIENGFVLTGRYRRWYSLWVRESDGVRVELSRQGISIEFSVPRVLRGGNHLLDGITEDEVGMLLYRLPEELFPGVAKRMKLRWLVTRLDLCVDFDGPVRSLARAMRYVRWGRVRQRGPMQVETDDDKLGEALLTKIRQAGKGRKLKGRRVNEHTPVDHVIDGGAVRLVRGSAKAVRLQMYDKGAEMARRNGPTFEPNTRGRWELLLRQPGNRKWAVKALAGDANEGLMLWLDAGKHAEPVAVPLDFVRLRGLVIGEVASIEDGVGVPKKNFREETKKRFRKMANAPMWTTNGKRKGSRLKARERMVLQRRQAYVLAIDEGLVERATGYLTLAG
jgi:hypothetical protein